MLPITPQTENYNETVLIPMLEKRVHLLTSSLILAEAKLEIALKEKDELEKQLKSAQPALATADTEDGA